MSKGRRARRVHRWVATIFTLTVSANFAAMLWGPPPAWITYAPLPPLLFLLLTGLVMLLSPWIAVVRGTPATKQGKTQ
jgi:peptidoglycan/LPS O-acetylase OafA/YrhL